VSQFLIQFHQLQGIEPEVGVANEYVIAVVIRNDFYLFHFLSAFKIVRVRIVILEDTFESLDFIIFQPDVSVAN
jgi:hypothetical protein